MVDPVTLARRKKRLYGGIAICAVVLVVFGKTLTQTIVAASAPPPPGYVDAATMSGAPDLNWDELYKGRWERKQKPSVPQNVASMDGQAVRVKGFMLPLHEPGDASEFFLAKSPGGCYFCNPPGVSEVVTAETEGGKKMSPTQMPVYAYGRLHVATGGPDDKALYVIDHAVFAIAK
jgi:hypothetical protein